MLVLSGLGLVTVLAGTTPAGQPCDPSAARLDPDTFKLESDCAQDCFCSHTTGFCTPKQCRSDEFPFGYARHSNHTPPPLCPQGSFCADEEDRCRPLLPLGSLCQMNRDDECAPPPSDAHASSSLCLNFTCTYADVQLGSPCLIDALQHIQRLPDGSALSVTTSRDNCIQPPSESESGNFCDPQTRVCVRKKALRASCTGDWECLSENCDQDTNGGGVGAGGLCAESPETPYRVTPLQYILSAIALVFGMISVCAMLVMVNARHRAQRRLEVEEYYREQTLYRNAINGLIAAVATDDVPEDESDDEYGDEDSRPLLLKRKGTWKFRIE
ncbi:hypothetical protein EXIGLDRAFT_770445 [Exidia glandulosa HHB12029]|uniref:Extracellular membrane protein CFEM domain-containing protein n=1 Tax=Exidia glandulosa HHB12029 TaxID=1314781 RepID=A0A165GR62_EXIGL|nr:hypothetical protein EXIGLDRAFT_770445 [Exidia glandulosa HHB12029]